MADVIVRPVKLDDACDLLKIYSPYVENTAVSFEYETPGLEEFKERIKNITQKFPYLVLCKDNEILGYTYASTFHARAAYNHSVELSIYIRKDCHNCGYGRILYNKLEEELKKKGFLVMYVCIAASSRNPDKNLTDASIKFHEKMGFNNAGFFKNCAKKFGCFYNIVYMQKNISSEFQDNEKTIDTSEVVDVYDNQKRVTGKTIQRSDFFENNGLLRLVIHLCIFNKEGKMLIQQRASSKKTGANIWDFSVSGQVMAGESSQEGAQRELKEELGILAQISQAPQFTKIFFNSYNDYYVLHLDCDPVNLKFKKDEVQDVKWASREEVLKLREKNKFLSYPESLIGLVFDIGQGKD
ncbi:MAG: GNAT family N-acetyltransferase [Treponema sp.]|nr:GNAT family N-acetyltransferase [Treponema sp.]